jgi:hypothetical protein
MLDRRKLFSQADVEAGKLAGSIKKDGSLAQVMFTLLVIALVALVVVGSVLFGWAGI